MAVREMQLPLERVLASKASTEGVSHWTLDDLREADSLRPEDFLVVGVRPAEDGFVDAHLYRIRGRYSGPLAPVPSSSIEHLTYARVPRQVLDLMVSPESPLGEYVKRPIQEYPL